MCRRGPGRRRMTSRGMRRARCDCRALLGERINLEVPRNCSFAASAQLKPLPTTSAVHIARAGNYDDAARGHFAAAVRALPPARAARGQETRAQAEPGRVSPEQGHQHRSAVRRGGDRTVSSGKGRRRSSSPRGRGTGGTCSYLVDESGLGDVLRKARRALRRSQSRRAGEDAQPRPAHRARSPVPVADGPVRRTCSSRCRSSRPTTGPGRRCR